jgi:hypothetical protein
VAALAVTFAATGGLAWQVPFGTAMGYGAAALLAQGLVRDVVTLALRRRSGGGAPRRIGCLCAESTVGLLLVALAVGITLLGISEPVLLTRPRLVGALAAVLIGGFVAKDYVVIVRRETDHASIAVW